MNRIMYEHVSCENIEGEEWKPVIGYEGIYEVSSVGRVKRVRGGPGAKAGKILRQAFSGSNYLYVMFCSGGKITKKRFRVHRLVALAFLGPEPEGMQVNHKDGDKANNRVSNLEYMTPQENSRHYHASHLQPTCKLTSDLVREIRASSEDAKTIAYRIGISLSTIYEVRRYATWRRVV